MPPTDGIADQRELGRVQLGPRAVVIVRTLRVQGDVRGDIRKFVIRPDGEEVPTRMGVSLPFERVDELRELVVRLTDACSGRAHDRGGDAEE